VLAEALPAAAATLRPEAAVAASDSLGPERFSTMSVRFGFVNTVSALCYTIVGDQPHTNFTRARSDVSVNAVVNFVIGQQGRMPDYLRAPLFLFTVLFDLAGLAHAGTPFHRQRPAVRRRQIEAWRRSRLTVARDLVRLYESLALFGWYSLLSARNEPEHGRPLSSERR
jgi:hypothetical protein